MAVNLLIVLSECELTYDNLVSVSDLLVCVLILI